MIKIPYINQSKYYHIRLKNPKSFNQKTFRTVSIFHTNYKGKYRRLGVLAITGFNIYLNKWDVQSLRVPKIIKIQM